MTQIKSKTFSPFNFNIDSHHIVTVKFSRYATKTGKSLKHPNESLVEFGVFVALNRFFTSLSKILHISVNENIFVEEYKVVMDFNEDVLSF